MNNRKKTKGRNFNMISFDGVKKTLKQILPTRQAIQSAILAMGIVEKVSIAQSKYNRNKNPNFKPLHKVLWNSTKQGTYIKALHGDLI